ncbi:MAG: alkaline phosphatase family protein, partial [Sphingobacteriaceae bacterium]
MQINKSGFFILLLLVIATFRQQASAQLDTAQHVILSRKNSIGQQKKPYVILISSDGFRYDYAEKYQAAHLLKLSKKGVRAASMIPSFPSLTFPNHYTIVTGLYPSHHGLVNNSFYDAAKDKRYSMSDSTAVRDSSWYGGTPLWVLAEQQQMLTASMFWVGSEAAIKGVRPTYYYAYNERITVDERIKIVKQWLNLPEEKRPHLITFYLSEPDHSSHTFGPEALQTKQAVKTVDSVLFELTKAVKSTGLPVNFVFVSDHGMTAVDREHPIATPAAIDPNKFIIPASGTMMELYAKQKADILPVYNQLKQSAQSYSVYLKSEMPAHFHYNTSDDRYNRIADILLLPKWPQVFANRKPGVGYHGFDPAEVKDMHASFMAWGPVFKRKTRIPSFENIHVYPMVTKILG